MWFLEYGVHFIWTLDTLLVGAGTRGRGKKDLNAAKYAS